MVSLSLLTLTLVPLAVWAQTVVNGQIFTNGLSIIDAPQPKTPFHGGANIPIAIDISGNGHLDQAASIPGSGKDTRFDLLQIFLVSDQTKLNLTVSEGPGLLQQEQGSTVKHLNYNLPSCVPPGNYNLTFYENSHINGTDHYTITYLPISIDNSSQSGSCSSNQLEDQPQAASALTQSPWLTQNGSLITYPGVSGASSVIVGVSTWAVVVSAVIWGFW